jgi:DNA-binding beta-propeller fold protein YncE
MGAVGLCLALALAGTAQAKQVYDYEYSGTYFDGSGSENGPFVSTIGGLGYDESSESLYVGVGGEPGTVRKFTLAGAPANFSSLEQDYIDLGRETASESRLAVDRSGGERDGNIYLVEDGFGSDDRTFGFHRDGSPIEPAFNEAGGSGAPGADSNGCGVAAGPNGEFWHNQNNGGTVTVRLKGFGQADLAEDLAILGNDGKIFPDPRPCAVVVDSAGNFYGTWDLTDDNDGELGVWAIKLPPEYISNEVGPPEREWQYRLNDASAGADPSVPGNQPRHMAIDPSNDDVFVAEGSAAGTGIAKGISQYDSAGSYLGSFGAPEPGYEGLQAAGGIVVDPATHDVWVSNNRNYGGGERHVERFVRGAPITVPTSETGDVSQPASPKEATLHGTLDPDGIETTQCYFEYGDTPSLGKKAPCAEGDSFAGSEAQEVSAQIEGLKEAGKYWYKLFAKNGNERLSEGGNRWFQAQVLPDAEPIYTDKVNTDGTTLFATVDPNGGRTFYHWEYGPTEAYGQTTPETALERREDDGRERLPDTLIDSYEIEDEITGLTPGTTHHFRLIVRNEAGTRTYPDLEFRTYLPDPSTDPCANSLVRQQTRASLLPDCRAYELASATNTDGRDVVSDLVPGQVPLPGHPRAEDRLLYSVDSGVIPGVAGNPTNLGRDPYVATRGPGGWSTAYVGLPSDGMADEGRYGSPLLEADPFLERFAFGGLDICSPCFADGSTNIPLREPGGSIVKGIAGSLDPGPADPEGGVAKLFSADGEHLVFGTPTKIEPAGRNGFATIYARDLASGETEVVSTLPDGKTIGGGEGEALDVSADGSRVLIGIQLSEDVQGNPHHQLYLHLAGKPKSVDLTPGTAAGVQLNGMSADGARVFYTTTEHLLPADTDESADIYEAHVDGEGALALSLVTATPGGPLNDDGCEPPGIPDAWNAAEGEGDCSAVAFAGGAGVAANGTFYFLSPELLDPAGGGETDQANLYLKDPGGAAEFAVTIGTSTGKPGPVEAVGIAQQLGPYPKPLWSRVPDNFFAVAKPLQVAVDNTGGASDGSVYVADAREALLRKYDAEGNPDTSWGDEGVVDGSEAPEGEELTWPRGVHIDAEGHVYVLDRYQPIGKQEEEEFSGSARLFEFDEGGSLVSFENFGHNSGDPAGTGISPDERFVYAGRSHFANSSNLIRFDRVGSESGRIFDWDKNPEFILGGEGANIVGIDVDPTTGEIYAAIEVGVIVRVEFNEAGEVLQEDGSACEVVGLGTGSPCDPTEIIITGLTGLRGLDLDFSNGHIYADLTDEVIEFDAEGNEVGVASGIAELGESSAVAVNESTGQLYASTVVGEEGFVAELGLVPTLWTPDHTPAIENALEDAEVHRSTDFQISPDGRYAAFGAYDPLTGHPNPFEREQIYRYDADAETVECASCAPSGAAARNDTSLSPHGLNLTDDGRVFFTSGESLALRDTNGRLDVYEWSGGAPGLISTGLGAEDSRLLTASADGRDAFFFTRDKLVGDDANGGAVRIYDAREGGNFFIDPPRQPCAASDECHGAGTPQPPAPNINTVTGAGEGSDSGTSTESCAGLSKGAKKHANRAKRLRRNARRSSTPRDARALRRRAARSAKKAKQMSRRAKACRSARRKRRR